MRVSGKGMDRNGAAFLGNYIKQGAQGWEIDTGAIDASMKEYFEQAASNDRYSISGLCIALGITRDTLELWRAGYVCGFDAQDKRTKPNAELAERVAMGEMYVHRYWEESDKSTTLHTKFLESAGLLGPRQPGGRRPPFDLGRLKKYCK
jgi:hypothetical protein